MEPVERRARGRAATSGRRAPPRPGSSSVAPAASRAPAERRAARRSSAARARAGRPRATSAGGQDEEREARARGRGSRGRRRTTRNSGTSAPRSNTERERELRRREIDVDRDRDERRRRDATTNAIETARRRVPDTRRTTGRAIAIRSTNSPIAAITREEDDPARRDEPRRRRRLGDRRDHELRRRPRVRPDGERERAAHRMAVDGDHAPVDEVPALGQAA